MKIISGLAEGQVLQRRGASGAGTVVRGESRCDGPVRVTISKAGKPLAGFNRRKAGAARRGRFTLTLTAIPAGGPYRLRLEADGETIAGIKEFFVGDVWILAGQSNMEGAGGLPGFSQPHRLVRAFSQRREWRLATDPLHVHAESPDACHNYGTQIAAAQGEDWRRRATVGAGPGLPFARERVKRTGVPQGLVCVARGGSSLSLWDPATKDQLYASMMDSVRATGQPVAGVLWYQGESDTSAEPSAVYTERMKQLVAATRRDLRQPRLPWAMVQLARVARIGSGEYWNRVQEDQRLLPQLIPHLAVVAAIDLSLDDEIHIGAEDQPKVGERLAHAADYLLGGKGATPPPSLRSARRTVSTEADQAPKCGVDVFFDGVAGGLKSDGEPSGFYLIDAAGAEVPWIFKTTLHGDHARLHIMRVPPPGARVGYGRGYFPRCNLTDGRGLAVPVFAPVEIGGMEAGLPFVTTWRVLPVVETAAPITEAEPPDFERPEAQVKSYGADGFVNEHAAWQGKSGHAWFAAKLELKRSVSLQFLMGYDGPFRLWLDGKSFFSDPRGENPCIADESGKVARLAAGTHGIVVCMDTFHGHTWGFFLRFRTPGGSQLPPDACVYGT